MHRAISEVVPNVVTQSWRHRVSRDIAFCSNSNRIKLEWSIVLKLTTYLSWEKVYPKMAFICLWRHHVNNYDVTKFSDFRLQLSVFRQCFENFISFSHVCVGNVIGHRSVEPKCHDVIMTSSKCQISKHILSMGRSSPNLVGREVMCPACQISRKKNDWPLFRIIMNFWIL